MIADRYLISLSVLSYGLSDNNNNNNNNMLMIADRYLIFRLSDNNCAAPHQSF